MSGCNTRWICRIWFRFSSKSVINLLSLRLALLRTNWQILNKTFEFFEVICFLSIIWILAYRVLGKKIREQSQRNVICMACMTLKKTYTHVNSVKKTCIHSLQDHIILIFAWPHTQKYLFRPRPTEGPIKSPLSVCLCVCLSVRHFSQNGSLVFLWFLARW